MVILVNEKDETIGYMPKLEAHQKGVLHRAFSVLIFNSQKQLLLQQRAIGKYHTPGKWTNTCCSHPYQNETPEEGAHRRLKEEMGMDAELKFLFKFQYKAPFDNELTEHEIDHVFIGFTDDLPSINTDEVNDFKYMHLNDIREDIAINPDGYTAWFKIIIEGYYEYIERHLL